jgi:hypothetical protein
VTEIAGRVRRRAGTMINPLDTPDGVLPLEVWRYEKRLADLSG